jgi:hypothetical protein
MYSSYSFLTLTLDGSEWSASCPDNNLPHRERTLSSHWIGGWVGLRAGLDTEDTGENPLLLPGMLQVKITLRLLSHWRNQLHENDHMRPPIFLACN